MPRSLPFTYKGKELSFSIQKVDRSKLYGTTKLEVHDDEGRICNLATLASDGKTLIPHGGTAFGYITPEGMWRDKSGLVPVNMDGEELDKVESSFKLATDLAERTDVDDYLTHNIRLVYELDPGGEIPTELLKELSDGAIFKFKFSYRGGVDPDTAFLFTDDGGNLWLMVGNPTTIEYIKLDQPGAIAVDPEEDDLLDFGMM